MLPDPVNRTRYIEPDLDNCNRKEIGEDNVPPQSHMLACVSDYWSILYIDCCVFFLFVLAKSARASALKSVG